MGQKRWAQRRELRRKQALQGGGPPKPRRRNRVWPYLLAAVLAGIGIRNCLRSGGENRPVGKAPAREDGAGCVTRIALLTAPELSAYTALHMQD